MTIEERLGKLDVELPDFGGPSYYGATYGKMKPYHRVGNILFLSGHVPDVDDGGNIIHPGALGDQVTLEQGYEAARITGINCLAGLKQAVGNLDNVVFSRKPYGTKDNAEAAQETGFRTKQGRDGQASVLSVSLPCHRACG